ncbi:MAG TPA: hypothetical protein VMF08_02890 [Candidatus Sulfotelmatobacter sp.]|nr:hypothetical protein [Candidatus Sulfotelmatobacter sp.]
MSRYARMPGGISVIGRLTALGCAAITRRGRRSAPSLPIENPVVTR